MHRSKYLSNKYFSSPKDLCIGLLMHRFTIDDLPIVFKNVFKKPDHKYPTKFAQFNCSLRKHSLSSSEFLISYRGAKLWNEILSTDEKELKSHMSFQKIVKSKLLAMENELSFF